jgi:hypothetical protein
LPSRAENSSCRSGRFYFFYSNDETRSQEKVTALRLRADRGAAADSMKQRAPSIRAIAAAIFFTSCDLTNDPEFESVESLIKIRWLTK